MSNSKRSSAGDDLSQAQVDRFDRLASDYISRHDEVLRIAGGDSGFFYQKKIELILDRLRGQPRRILDYGCGIGRLTALLANAFPNAEICGYDPSAASIKEAEKAVADLSNVVLSSSFDDIENKFDMLVMAGVLHHIPDIHRTRIVHAIISRLDSDAQFFFFEHNPLSPALRLLLWIKKCDEGAELIYPWRMLRLLRKEELNDLRCEFLSFFPTFLGPLLKLERWLTGIPFGAQYLIWGKTP
jgi:2-polyprenyl-3-methyl-5-hydroxy-6-metoxy-1,4-benzoquinol methylase